MTVIVETPDDNELLHAARGRQVRARGVTSYLPTKTIALQSYELRLEDFGARLLFTDTCTVTVPANSKVPVTSGSVQVVQMGAGQLTFAGAVGVTVNTPETLKTNKQYATAVLTCDAANTFVLAGYLEAAA